MKPLDEILTRALEMRKELLHHQIQLKEEFLSLVSHELRSPLTAIYQFTTIILDGLAGDVSPEQREYLEISLRNIRQLQGMINDLLSATRARSGALGVLPERMSSLSTAVGCALDSLGVPAEDKQIALNASEAPGLPDAYADPSLLRQVLIHLIHNAIKFSPEGGRVEVRIGRLPDDPSFLLLEVVDNGCGMPENLADRVFERLSQLSDPELAGRRGLGLGLYIAQELVERQGGKIWLESKPDHGSTFSFTVPAFSLSKLIAPVVTNVKRAPDSLSLVTVEVGGDGDSGAARELLRRRLVPRLEVLLPETEHGDGKNRFVAVAAVEENSGQSVASRMEERLTRSKRLGQLGLSFATSSRAVEPLSCPADASLADSLADRLALAEAKIHSLLATGAGAEPAAPRTAAR